MLIKEHNTTTNKIIERELNAEELAQQEIDKAELKAAKAKAEAEDAARVTLLEKLGITADEAKLLLG